MQLVKNSTKCKEERQNLHEKMQYDAEEIEKQKKSRSENGKNRDREREKDKMRRK